MAAAKHLTGEIEVTSSVTMKAMSQKRLSHLMKAARALELSDLDGGTADGATVAVDRKARTVTVSATWSMPAAKLLRTIDG